MDRSESRHRVSLKPWIEEPLILSKTQSNVLKKLERQFMHQVVVRFKSMPNPLIFFLGRERSWLKQGVSFLLITDEMVGASHVIHHFVSRIIWLNWSQASEVIFILWVVMVPQQLVQLLLRHFIKCLACLKVWLLIKPIDILQCKKANFCDAFFDLSQDLFIWSFHIYWLELYHLLWLDHVLQGHSINWFLCAHHSYMLWFFELFFTFIYFKSYRKLLKTIGIL